MIVSQYWLNRGPNVGMGVVACTPADTGGIVGIDGKTHVAIGFRVGTGGTVSFLCPDGSTDSITCADKEYVPIPVLRINAAGTSASGIKYVV